MTQIDLYEEDEYPVELMGENPSSDLILRYNKKDSIMNEVNSESPCEDTEG